MVERPRSIEGPASVDPLQPNITYREPDVGGYHSRCSTPRDYIFIENDLSQTRITSPTSRRHSSRASPSLWRENDAKKTDADQMILISGLQSQSVGKRQPQSLIRTQQCKEQPTSQQMRLEKECKSMDETRALKRRAQIVPHRIDLPFYMSGLSAQLSNRYYLDEKDIEKLRLMQTDVSGFRKVPVNKRTGETRLRTNSPVGMKLSSRRPRDTPSSGKGKKNRIVNVDGTVDVESEITSAEQDESVLEQIKTKQQKEQEEILLQYKGGKRITVGGYALKSSGEEPFSEDFFHQELAGNIDAVKILSNKQKRAFEAIFNDIDFDSNGKVTFDELVHRLFSNVSKRDAKLLMKIFDVDRSKFIDRREFVTICALNDKLCGFRTESKYDCLRLDLEDLSKYLLMCRDLFDMLDRDGDSKIHVDELMLIMSTGIGKEIGMNQNIVQSVMDNIDRDKNGFIDFVGFLLYVPFFLRLHNSMMNSTDLKLREIQEMKDEISEQLRSKINSPSS